MRLTLRTLLAYIDELLDPKDAADFKERISQSEMATNLLYRVQDVMRRLRLKAPSVDEDSDGLDPNTVSEYLDNVLPDDRVPDFEKVCLESDMQLAEVASCHQILAIVLGEGAEIDEATIQHMYQLPEVAAEQELMARQQEEAVSVIPSMPEKPTEGPPASPSSSKHFTPPPTPRSEIPEYLREPKRSSRLIPTMMLVFAVLCTVTIVMAMKGKLAFLGIGMVEQPSAVALKEPNKTEPDVVKTEPAESKPVAETVAEAAKPEAESEPVQQTEPQPVQSETSEPLRPKVPSEPVDEADEPVEKTDAAPIVQPEEPAEKVDNEPAEAEMPTVAVAEKPEQPEVEEPEKSTRVGTLLTGAREILVQSDPESGGWKRVTGRDELKPNTALASLTTYRPAIGLSNSTVVRLIDGAELEVQPGKVPQITLKPGRFIIQALGQPGSQIRLKAANIEGTVTLLDAGSTMAIDLLPLWTEGTDPEKSDSELIANFYACGGKIGWAGGAEPAATKVEIGGEDEKSPRLLILENSNKFQANPLKELPSWITDPGLGKLDLDASMALQEKLADRSVTLVLREMLPDRRVEYGRLAVGCLAHLGEVEPLVAVLNDEKRTPIWPDTVGSLGWVVRHDKKLAEKVHQAMDKLYGSEGESLYRMLWGYTDEQLAAGADVQLVKNLADPLLAKRVLAYWTLRGIVGGGPYFKPDSAQPKREQAVRRWQDQQKKGLIRHNKKR